MVGRQAEAISTSGRQFGIAEDATAPGMHIGGGHEQFGPGLGEAGEIDSLLQDLVQRIGAAAGDAVGRIEACREIGGDEGRRKIERPLSGQNFEWTTPEGAQQGRIGNPLPERLERHLRALGAAFVQTMRHHHRVHGAGRGPGNAVELQPGLFEQPVEHAPGVGTVRAAALQREIDENRFATPSRRRSFFPLAAVIFHNLISITKLVARAALPARSTTKNRSFSPVPA